MILKKLAELDSALSEPGSLGNKRIISA